MRFPQLLDQIATDSAAGLVYGQPHQTPGGATIIPVTRIRGSVSSAVGVFVVHDDRADWVPVVDANRIALIGVCTGLLAAVIGTLAVLRRPPWPDLHG
ncbi:MAG TPA: hypothetical protein VF299_01075 [Mycobacterium sp.]